MLYQDHHCTAYFHGSVYVCEVSLGYAMSVIKIKNIASQSSVVVGVVAVAAVAIILIIIIIIIIIIIAFKGAI